MKDKQMDEQARECAELLEKGIRVSFRMQDASDSSTQAFIAAVAALIEPFLAKVRLAELTELENDYHEKGYRTPALLTERLLRLRQAAGEGTKP